METEVVVLSDGTTVEVRAPTGADYISAHAQNEFIRVLKLIAACVVKVNGEEKTLHYMNDVAKWKLGDINRVGEAILKLSGIEPSEARNF